jgi:outer membrane protein OmpA-like peptidoglycan-associated protein
MKQKRFLAATCLAALTLAAPKAQAQCCQDKPQPYTFITVQGGAQVTFTNADFEKLITPIGAVSVGRFFVPAVGARLSVQGWNDKGGTKIGDNNVTYKYKYVTSDLDLLFNLSNIFCPGKTHTFNAILLGGVGLTYAWDNDEQRTVGLTEPLSWTDDRLVHNFRIGMQFDVNVTRWLGVNLEIAANHLNDRFNAKHNGGPDWQATAMLGLSFKLGKKHTPCAPAPVAPPPVVETPAPAPAPEPTPEPVVVKEKEKTSTHIFFTINSAEVSSTEEQKVATLASWLKNHPEAQVSITGYADAGTGTAAINHALSQKRADGIYTLLTEKYGIAANRITSNFVGDTIQPFSDNDSNRVVIAVAEEK